VREQLVSDDAMKVWAVAFTHRSVNPNRGENYEILEKIGDKVIGLMFILYLLTKFPDFEPKELSELSNYYLSKEQLANISYDLKFTIHARTGIRGINLGEDIFESVFGALIKLGQTRIIQKGLEFSLCENFLYWIFNRIEIDIEKTRGKPKTQVTQIFQKANWGEVETEWIEEEGTFIIYYPKAAIEEIKEKLGHVIPKSRILAKVTGKLTKKAAEEEAYKIALDELTKLNITMENVKTIFGDDLFENKEIKPHLQKFKSKLKEKGISSTSFRTFIRGKEIKVQLLGTKEDKSIEILAEAEGENILRAKINAVKEFLKEEL
jgi:dsRNA-specific ribonuclease